MTRARAPLCKRKPETNDEHGTLPRGRALQSDMRLQILVFVTLVRTAVADPVIKSTAVKAADLPTGVTVRGTFQSGVTFKDKNGTNYLLFGSSSDQKQNSAMLFVEDWVVPAKGAPRNLLPVRDLVEPCEMGGVTAKFHDAARAVTDLDGDGIAEVTFAYELACRSDVSTATYKLLVLENGRKYILRGETTVDPGDGVMGGTFTADPAEAKWPAAFLTHAKQVWAKTKADIGIRGEKVPETAVLAADNGDDVAVAPSPDADHRISELAKAAAPYKAARVYWTEPSEPTPAGTECHLAIATDHGWTVALLADDCWGNGRYYRRLETKELAVKASMLWVRYQVTSSDPDEGGTEATDFLVICGAAAGAMRCTEPIAVGFAFDGKQKWKVQPTLEGGALALALAKGKRTALPEKTVALLGKNPLPFR